MPAGEGNRSPQEVARADLQSALAAVGSNDACDSVRAVADEMPVALSADFVNLRLLGSDHNLYLVAASGCATIEIRKRAFQPLSVARVRDMVDSGEHATVGLSLGVTWMHVEWIAAGGEELGTIALGARTKRRPSRFDLALLTRIATDLGERLADADRSAAALEACSLRLARAWSPVAWTSEIAELRPRELTILELYADGLSTSDIAELLFISPHTVRTHVKLAMRRLGVHTRADAASLVRADQVAQLL